MAASHLRRILLCLELYWKRWWTFLSLVICFLILKSKFKTSWPYLWYYKDHTQKSRVWITEDFYNKNVIYPVHVHQHISYKLWNEEKKWNYVQYRDVKIHLSYSPASHLLHTHIYKQNVTLTWVWEIKAHKTLFSLLAHLCKYCICFRIE